MLDEELLADSDLLARRDRFRLLWQLAGAGAQVRRATQTREDFGVAALRDAAPRALLVATDLAPASAQRVLARLAGDAVPALDWPGLELPRWAGPADALLVGAVDGDHPRLATLTEQATRRGMVLAVVAAPDTQVAFAAARAPLAELPADLGPHAARWAVLTPLLQALDAMGLARVPAGLLDRVAAALDETAESCRPGGELFVNPAKSLAVELAETRPVLAGAGPLADAAARSIADALQLAAGVPAVPVALPDGVAQLAALLGGPGTSADPDDFFRDRVEDAAPRRAGLLLVGDDGDAADLPPGEPVPPDELAARRAASAVRTLAEERGVRVFDVPVPDGPALARFAAATAFGDFTAAYLGFGLGLDPGAPRAAGGGR